MNSQKNAPDVLVIGGGVIGLAIAWRSRQRGRSVTVVDPAPGAGASTVAAGMLAPVTELNYGETELLPFGIESARRYPAFAAELRDATGIDIGYRPCGTIVTAWDGADLAALRDLHRLQTTLGLRAELISGRELRALEPALAPGLPGGLLAADDHQVDNRRLHAALLQLAGDTVIRQRVESLEISGDRVIGVRLADGQVLTAGTVVLAAGAWSRRFDDIAVRPVKGQTLRLHVPGEALLTHVVRGTVKGSRVYIVPRSATGSTGGSGGVGGGVGDAGDAGDTGGGEIVVGASSEETGFDTTPRAGAIYELLRDAQSLVPALGEAQFREVSTGLRPAAPDNAPIIGPSARLDGLVIATAHYRNGILLAPITADAVATLIETGVAPAEIAPFGPGRFLVTSR